MGTCERNVRWFFENCANQFRNGGVDVHFSGHSHRAGVYTTARSGNAVKIESAFDPGLQPAHAANAIEAGKTKFIVSSCGGPIGVQNLNDELGGWTLTPPSGTLYDPSAKVPFRQVAYTKGSAQPRLAVALDYMHLSKVERVLHWEHAKGNSFFMVVGPKTHRLACIAGVRLWGFGKTRNPPGETTWIPFDTVLKFRYVARGSAFESPVAAPQSGIYEMTLPAGRQAEITMLQAAKTTRWFCEVTLQAPKGLPVEHFKLDSWFFPVDFTTRKTGIELVPMLCRRVGEQGEVPDWKWLNTTFRERYLDPKIATHVDK